VGYQPTDVFRREWQTIAEESAAISPWLLSRLSSIIQDADESLARS